MIKINNTAMHPLKKSILGKHKFGGKANHKGAIPKGSLVSTHKILTLDLNDPKIPFSSDKFRYLPLYYPLKYGLGGPSMQYSVISDNEIDIIFLSDPIPDSEDEAYVQVDGFPSISYKLLPTIPNDEAIDWFTITIGGTTTLDHEADTCQNKNCQHYQSDPNVDLIASVPPISIKRHPEIWWEFDGAYMLFYFWLCRGCNTIITSNRCT